MTHEIKKLAKQMRALESLLGVCMRCGTCQAVCPLFAETGRESDVARGKIAMLDGLMQEMFRNPAGVNERLNKCLLCGSCAANCPAGVKVPKIFLKARAILTAYMGISPVKRLILRGMLAHPAFFDWLAERSSGFQKIFTKPANPFIGTSCTRFVSPPGLKMIGDRHFIAPAPIPFHRITPFLNTGSGRSGIRVAFYVGCLTDKIFPRVAQATVDVLNHHGVGIFMPENQGCCGIPALSCGDTETFLRLLCHNVEKFSAETFDYLVTPCATCTYTIKKIWRLMSEDAPGNIRVKVKELAEKTMDIHQFLVLKTDFRTASRSVPASHKTDKTISVTYHDSCHLKKSLGVYSEPRAVISGNPAYRLIEMPESDRCCGLGGTFSLQYYDISADIGKRKRNNIVSTACSSVAAGCPACMMQLSDMLSKAGDNIAVKHPIEIYAEMIKGEPGARR